jgi:phenylacetate-CoA ligase
MDRRGLKPRDFRTGADLAKLPLIDGLRYTREPERFQAARRIRASGLTIESSGTSGRSKHIRYDARALFLALAQGHRQRCGLSAFTGGVFGYREMHMVRTGSVAVQIRHFYEKYSSTPPHVDLMRQFLSPGDLSFSGTLEAINKFQPDVIRGYGSYLGALFREAHLRGVRIHHPRVIVYGADAMAEGDRRLIEQELGIPVSSTYQSVEALRIGFECERGHGFHLSLDAVAVRVVDDQGKDVEPGGTGHIVISNLTNRATVLLNYKLGDVVTRSAGACECGRTLPMIEAIQGRSDDVLRLGDGRVMHALVALEPLRAVPGVLQLQVVQQARNRFILRAVAQSGVARTEAAGALIRALESKVGTTGRIEVDWVEALPPGQNGKVKAVISEVGD